MNACWSAVFAMTFGFGIAFPSPAPAQRGDPAPRTGTTSRDDVFWTDLKCNITVYQGVPDTSAFSHPATTIVHDGESVRWRKSKDSPVNVFITLWNLGNKRATGRTTIDLRRPPESWSFVSATGANNTCKSTFTIDGWS